MGFWETAAAALVGGVGVLFIAGLSRVVWIVFKMHYTPFGRHQLRIGMSIHESLKEAERREKEQETK